MIRKRLGRIGNEQVFSGYETVKAINVMNRDVEDRRNKRNNSDMGTTDFTKYVPQILQVPKNKYSWTGLDMLQDSRARLQETKSTFWY